MCAAGACSATPVEKSSVRSWALVVDGLRASTSAAPPEASGVENDVPVAVA